MKGLNCIFFSLLLISCTNLFAQKDKAFKKVEEILNIQAEHWNNGDIDAFMDYYWKSDNLQFIGSNGITYGWQNTLDNYKKRYPDLKSMGKLKFEVIKTDRRSRKVITLVGKFHLSREIGDLEGIFLLVWKKIKGKWVIVADQTC